MPPLLGPADSFNSSSATIRPDDHQRPRPLPRAGGGLGPADSVGRELDAILGGHVGVLQSDNGVGDNALLNSYLASYRTSISTTGGANNTSSNTAGEANASSSSSASALGRVPSEFNPLAFLNDPTGGADGTFFADLGIDPAIHSGLPSTSSAPAADAPIGAELYRPSSSHSHRSRVSLSSTDVDTDGFYTTDMDTDDNDVGPSPGPNPVSELDQLNLNGMSPFSATAPSPAPATISPDAEGLGGRRESTTKRARTAAVADTEEQRRLDRLEHRRSINRRSAQKHRLRRKEELETLSRQLAERDAKIAQLEKDLAVSRAQLQQLIALVGPRLAGEQKK